MHNLGDTNIILYCLLKIFISWDYRAKVYENTRENKNIIVFYWTFAP